MKKPVNAVMEAAQKDEVAVLAEIYWQWCDLYNDYVAEKALNVAIKRARADDGTGDAEMPEEPAEENSGAKGKAKGKGKAQKGPVKGCWECQGDHYASECPNLRFAKPQWNNIKPDLYPQPAWSRMYGAIQDSWKGKGKGKGGGLGKSGGKGKGKGGKGKGQGLCIGAIGQWDFPPLSSGQND